MSELMNGRDCCRNPRWQLLATVSALALLASSLESTGAQAEDQDADRPTVWIELGGQLERVDSSQQAFAPSFLASIAKPSLASALDVQKPPSYALGTEGKISFEPESSDWVFSASVRYGRSNMRRHRHQQTANSPVHLDVTYNTLLVKYGSYYPSLRNKFADGKASQSSQHLVLDFQAGKDIGIGLFGGHGSSVLSAGVRFAQFTSKAQVTMRALPDLQYPTAPIVGTLFAALPALNAFKNAAIHFHAYTGLANSERSFRGVGPSAAWEASMPFAGSAQIGELTFDWGANASLLFGRQKAAGQHQTTARTYYKNHWAAGARAGGTNAGNHGGNFGLVGGHFAGGTQATAAFHNPAYTGGAIGHRSNAGSFNRMRSVTVPNLGAFAGISYLYSNAKVSFGYRADFFFGAMDNGIDTRQVEDVGFHGPFATISVGLP